MLIVFAVYCVAIVAGMATAKLLDIFRKKILLKDFSESIAAIDQAEKDVELEKTYLIGFLARFIVEARAGDAVHLIARAFMGVLATACVMRLLPQRFEFAGAELQTIAIVLLAFWAMLYSSRYYGSALEIRLEPIEWVADDNPEGEKSIDGVVDLDAKTLVGIDFDGKPEVSVGVKVSIEQFCNEEP